MPRRKSRTTTVVKLDSEGRKKNVQVAVKKHRAAKRVSVVIPPAKEGQGRDARKLARRASKRERLAALPPAEPYVETTDIVLGSAY